MHVITLRQPYATLVALGARTLISAALCPTWRGRVAILGTVPSKREIRSELQGVLQSEPARSWLMPYGYEWLDQMPSGMVVARARLADCLPRDHRVIKAALARQPYEAALTPVEAHKRWALILTHIESIKPTIAVRGSAAYSELDVDTALKVLAAPATDDIACSTSNNERG